MWLKEIKNLELLKEFIVNNITYSKDKGFSFCNFNKDTELLNIIENFGIPDEENIENIQQQTLKYKAIVRHRNKNVNVKTNFEVLFWAFNQNPLKIIRFHLNYIRTGQFAEEYTNFIKLLFNEIVEKFGTPINKTFRLGNEELLYKIRKQKLYLWNNSEGLRIEIK